MSWGANELGALKSPDVLHAYCAKELGNGRRRGRLVFYPCPWGSHERLKLEVTEKEGVGVAMCRACGKGGSVIDVAAGVLGMDARRDFRAVVEHVAQVTGCALPDADAPRSERNRGRRQVALPKRQAAVERADDEGNARYYLPAEEEAAAWAAVRRAAASAQGMQRYADELGLPLDLLMAHTDRELAEAGMLGLEADGHLLYVYTCRDETGAVRAVMTKRRGWKGEPRFLCGKGSHKQVLFGADAIGESELVIITEGESDALAARAALWAWLEWWSHNEPDSYPEERETPVVVAKPDAGTFREAWAAVLKGKDVMLCVDNDEAGRKGAVATAKILKGAGVCRVFAWSPEGAAKDVRTVYTMSNPVELMDDMILNKYEI